MAEVRLNPYPDEEFDAEIVTISRTSWDELFHAIPAEFRWVSKEIDTTHLMLWTPRGAVAVKPESAGETGQ